jgi:hypothetical protein
VEPVLLRYALASVAAGIRLLLTAIPNSVAFREAAVALNYFAYNTLRALCSMHRNLGQLLTIDCSQWAPLFVSKRSCSMHQAQTLDNQLAEGVNESYA